MRSAKCRSTTGRWARAVPGWRASPSPTSRPSRPCGSCATRSPRPTTTPAHTRASCRYSGTGSGGATRSSPTWRGGRSSGVLPTRAAGALRVLDVGCGSSRIIGSGQMVGLDIVLAKLRYARRYGNPLVHGSIFALPFKDGVFDSVICSEVIEHVAADERVFSELERVL